MVLLARSKTKEVVDLAGHSGKTNDQDTNICLILVGFFYVNLKVKTVCHMINICTAAQLELLRQLTIRHLEKEYLSLSNSLWIVLELSITMAAMVAFLLKPLNTLNPTVASTQRKLILTPGKMEPANFQRKTSVYKSSTQSTLLW